MTETGEPIRVLVTEDDDGYRRLSERLLTDAGFVVDAADSGPEALRRIPEQMPECILMDVRMPGMDGIEAFRLIRRRWPQCIVIFMTGYAAQGLVEETRYGEGVEAINPSTAEQAARRIAKAASEKGALVLAEDPTFCRSLSEVLTAQAFDVDCVGDVDAAIVRFAGRPRQVVILERGAIGGAVLMILELSPMVIVSFLNEFKDRERADDGPMACPPCFTKSADFSALIRTIRERVERMRRGR